MEVGGPGFDAGVLVVNKGREILRVLTWVICVDSGDSEVGKIMGPHGPFGYQ